MFENYALCEVGCFFNFYFILFNTRVPDMPMVRRMGVVLICPLLVTGATVAPSDTKAGD